MFLSLKCNAGRLTPPPPFFTLDFPQNSSSEGIFFDVFRCNIILSHEQKKALKFHTGLTFCASHGTRYLCHPAIPESKLQQNTAHTIYIPLILLHP
jgi:hypothetical protein